MCTQCSFMVACFINQVNNEQICIDCAADAQNVIPMESNLDHGDLDFMVSNAAKNIESYLETMDSELENLTTRYIMDKANIEKNILSFVSYYQESLSRNEESWKLMEQKFKDAKLMLQRFNAHMMITRIMNILCDDKVNECGLKIEFRGDFIQIDGSLEYLKNPETNVTINNELPNYDTSLKSCVMIDFHTSTPNKRMRQEYSTNVGAKSFPQFQLAHQLEFNHEPCDHAIDSNYHDLKITHVRDPFWLYIERPKMKEKRKAILESLKNLKHDEFMNAVSIRQNDIVIVKDHPSFKEPIKRAQVSFYNLAKKKWKLKLIDFGNSIEVDAKQIYTAKQDLSIIDMTVVRAKLFG
uniref:Tudor domain-containing protein n=1 Tax=Tetranychus urticae TaxID=32264 RepID=T1K383_TETUR